MPYRNETRHRQKSRDAARSRRSKESEVGDDLSDSLPLPPSAVARLDKTSAIRIAVAFIKLRTLLGPKKSSTKKAKVKLDSDYLNTLDGFFLMLSEEGNVVYVTENITKYLGIPQVDLLGQSMYEFSHPCDHSELREVLHRDATRKLDSTPVMMPHSISLRMKCTLTDKGNSITIKSAGYKVIECSGYFKTFNTEPVTGIPGEKNRVLLLMCESIINPASNPVKIDSSSFLSTHSVDMKYTSVEDKVYTLLGYTPKNLIGKSAYHFHHAADSVIITKKFKDLFTKGQALIARYRMMARYGGYCWMTTQATVIYHPRTEKPTSIVCVNTVISDIEDRCEAMSLTQCEEQQHKAPVPQVLVDPVSSALPEVTQDPISLHASPVTSPQVQSSVGSPVNARANEIASPTNEMLLLENVEHNFSVANSLTQDIIVFNHPEDFPPTPIPDDDVFLNQELDIIEEQNMIVDDKFLNSTLDGTALGATVHSHAILSGGTVGDVLVEYLPNYSRASSNLKRQLVDNPFMGSPSVKIKHKRCSTSSSCISSPDLSPIPTTESTSTLGTLLQTNRQTLSSSNSVLKNLLLLGEDSKTGYTCKKLGKSKSPKYSAKPEHVDHQVAPQASLQAGSCIKQVALQASLQAGSHIKTQHKSSTFHVLSKEKAEKSTKYKVGPLTSCQTHSSQSPHTIHDILTMDANSAKGKSDCVKGQKLPTRSSGCDFQSISGNTQGKAVNTSIFKTSPRYTVPATHASATGRFENTSKITAQAPLPAISEVEFPQLDGAPINCFTLPQMELQSAELGNSVTVTSVSADEIHSLLDCLKSLPTEQVLSDDLGGVIPEDAEMMDLLNFLTARS